MGTVLFTRVVGKPAKGKIADCDRISTGFRTSKRTDGPHTCTRTRLLAVDYGYAAAGSLAYRSRRLTNLDDEHCGYTTKVVIANQCRGVRS